MTEPPSQHRMPGASPTPSANSNDSFDGLISDITSALTDIMALSEEFTHQSAEMLSTLDTLPPELRAKRDVICAAWAGAGALAEHAARRASTLERLIGQALRGERPCSL